MTEKASELLQWLMLVLSTHPKKADGDPQRQEEGVSHHEAKHPNYSQPPADELVVVVGSGEQVPRLEFFRFET